MKKFAVMVMMMAFVTSACTSGPSVIDAAHNSHNSLAWAGVYTGTIPAADGAGINVTITLRYDLTYAVEYQYIGRQSGDFTFAGTFKWNKKGNSITLDTKNIPPYYRVGENRLIQLDMAGKPIAGQLAADYVLIKQP